MIRLLEETARSLRRGTAVATFVWLVYGYATGLAGDVFVAFAHDFGANAMILATAAVTLYAMYGGAIVIEWLVLATTLLGGLAIALLRGKATITFGDRRKG